MASDSGSAAGVIGWRGEGKDGSRMALPAPADLLHEYDGIGLLTVSIVRLV